VPEAAISAPLAAPARGAARPAWQWLATAVQMAAAAGWPPSGGSLPLGYAGFPRVATRTPPPDAGSLSAVREFTAATLRRWGVSERCDDIVVVVSELLTNALRHAQPAAAARPARPVRLGLFQPGPCVLCAVADPSDQVPIPREPDWCDETGRGLHVVESLSDGWGCTTPGRLGKVVWATFSTGSCW
jgi:Histidine kinase-like ATPase domain